MHVLASVDAVRQLSGVSFQFRKIQFNFLKDKTQWETLESPL